MKNHSHCLIIVVFVCIFSFLLPEGINGWASAQEPQRKSASPRPNGDGGEDPPAADLGVSKTSDSDEVMPGADITYSISVTNDSSVSAEDATLTDAIPVGLTFLSLSSPAGWECTTPAVGSGGTITCTNPSLAQTAGDLFMLVVRVPEDAEGGTFFSNTATVSTTTLDPNEENNSSTASSLVAGDSADVFVSKSASQSEVVAGSSFTYTIEVTNAGPDTATSVMLSDALPGELTFASLSAPPGWNCETPAFGSGGSISCTTQSMEVVTDTFTAVVVVRPDTPEGTVITNTANVSTTTSEPSEENNSSTTSITVLPRDPTAANGKVTGAIIDERGRPVAGAVVRMEGTQSRKTITDSNGNYSFDKVETNGLYTVTPSRANYSFSPFNRSFSLVGNHSEAAFTGVMQDDSVNPLDTAEYFVRQQYVDILNREPDEAGFNYWSDQILGCGDDAACVRTQRTSVAAAFFIENEFRHSGAFIYDVYASAFGRRPVYSEYAADRSRVVGGPTLAAQKQQFAESFVTRGEFMTRFANNLTADLFVDALLANAQAAGIDLSSQRDSLISRYNAGTSLNESRSFVLRDISDRSAVRDAHHNAAFVTVEYFGYLHRTPERSGFDFWLNVLNQGRSGDPSGYRSMVCSFVTSAEYQRRFSSVVSHSNAGCGNQ